VVIFHSISCKKDIDMDDSSFWPRGLHGLKYWPYTAEQLSGVNAVDEFGRTKLMRAVKQRDCSLVETLLKEGADPNLEAVYPYQEGRPRYAGITALILAVQNDDIECAKLLILYGANPNMSALYTDPGMGNYTKLPRDFCRSEQMRHLLDAYNTSPERGEWAQMLDRLNTLKS